MLYILESLSKKKVDIFLYLLLFVASLVQAQVPKVNTDALTYRSNADTLKQIVLTYINDTKQWYQSPVVKHAAFIVAGAGIWTSTLPG
jgi:hypothetical protein